MKKYLFDLHSFDEPTRHDEVVEDLPPPPPTYTSDDMATATDEAYRRGRQDGYRESEEAISREIATLIGVMNSQLDDLLQYEARRQSQYTENLIISLQNLYAQTVPTLIEHQAWPMLARMAQDVVEQHKAATALEFTVPDIYVDTLKAHLEKLYGARASLFAVKGDKLMALGDCRIAWLNGGAIQDLGALQAQIRDRLNQLLAENSAAAQDHTAEMPIAASDSVIDSMIDSVIHEEPIALAEPADDDRIEGGTEDLK